MTTREPSPAGRDRISSLWMQQALDAEAVASPEAAVAAPSLHGEVRADVCIVGGGYTGLWTALAIKEREPSASVVVLEASVCGAGASGMNGGFAMTWWPKFGTLRKLLGTEDAVRLGQMSEDAVESIGTFCASSGIDVDFAPSGWLWAATNRAQLGSWDETLEELDRAGASPYRLVDAAEAAAMAGSQVHVGGVFEAGVATVHPARLVRGLRTAALERGIQIFEHSPMTSIRDGDGRPVVMTPRGRVAAGSVALATNAALARYREVRRNLLILGSDVVATVPVPRQLEKSGWVPGLAVSDSRRLVHYYRTTQDGRIVFGKGGGRLGFAGRVDSGFLGESRRGPEVTEHLYATYPELRGTTVTHAWTGAVDYSIDGLPFFGALDDHPRVFYGVGFSGNGVGPSYVAGQILASLTTGRADDWSTNPLVRSPRGFLPPEPIRYLGGQLVRHAITRKERLEDRGERPDRGTKLLAGLDPTGFVG
jgi:putative aminophosphonate oxidoreductase